MAVASGKLYSTHVMLMWIIIATFLAGNVWWVFFCGQRICSVWVALKVNLDYLRT